MVNWEGVLREEEGVRDCGCRGMESGRVSFMRRTLSAASGWL